MLEFGPCPEIAGGEGAVVTGRIVPHEVPHIVRLRMEDGTELAGTPVHPIWSVDRSDWTQLGQLRVGEQLLTEQGPMAVASANWDFTPQSVFNLEINGEHVYQVTDLGILVHNANPLFCRFVELLKKKAAGEAYDADELAKLEKLFAPRGLVNVTEEASDRLGRWFARYGDDGAETFSARLLNGSDELGISWTGNVRQLADNIAEVQGAIGRSIPRITGVASDGLEATIKAGRFNGNLYAQTLARRLGGQWSVEAVKRPGSDVWDIIATRIGG